jgi:hypothetical protein
MLAGRLRREKKGEHMRYYSKFEKKLIELMIKLHDDHQYNCATNILFDINGIYGLTPGFQIIIRSENEAQLAIESEKYKDLSNLKWFHMEIVRQLYEFVLLIDHLSSNQYIVLSPQKKQFEKPWEGYIVFDVLDVNLQKKLAEYFSCMFVPTRKLDLLKKYKYQNLETYNFNRQFKITTLVASISAFISIVSAAISIANLNTTQNIEIKNREIKIEGIIKSMPEQKLYYYGNINK